MITYSCHNLGGLDILFVVHLNDQFIIVASHKRYDVSESPATWLFVQYLIQANYKESVKPTSVLQASCDGNPSVTGGFPHNGPVILKAFSRYYVIMSQHNKLPVNLIVNPEITLMWFLGCRVTKYIPQNMHKSLLWFLFVCFYISGGFCVNVVNRYLSVYFMVTSLPHGQRP